MSEKIDNRFVYPQAPKWRGGLHQKLQGFETLTFQPTTKSPTLYEFVIDNLHSILLFGPTAGFRVKGVFEVKADAAAADSTFAAIPAADYATVALIPNWFETLVKSVDVFHNNTQLKCDDVPKYVDAYLNCYLNSMMDKEVKDYLYPEPHNPGRCVPIKKAGFTVAADSEWHEYSKLVYGKPNIEFRYVPLHTFPFFQQPEFGANGSKQPAAFPMALLEKVTIAINLKEDFSGIFRKIGTKTVVDANTKVYRFRIQSVELVVDEARLQPAYEKTFLKRTSPYLYPGVTRYGMVESIPAGLLAHRTELPKIDYPEAVFIFALSNKVIGGQYKYQEETRDPSDTIFLNHNIQQIDLTYCGKPLFIKQPNPGHIKDNLVAIRHMVDHKEKPPFGIPQNPELVTWESLRDGGANSNFPHVYLPLYPSTNETRIVPPMEDGKLINHPGELHINFKFGPGGALAGATYFIYLFYNDVTFVFDPRTHSFTPYYQKVRTGF